MTNVDFKIHSICLTRNEADVVEHCLLEAAKWSDYIYVYDGQSTDGTWEIVQAMKHPRIIPWRQDGKVFQESLRGEVFRAFRHLASDGDWWMQLNADEFYPDDQPRAFLSLVPRHEQVVWGIPIEYYLTLGDVATLDFTRPAKEILPLLRHYRADHSEIRLFRHRPGLSWGDAGWPEHLGLVHRRRIRFKHYPFRSPQQIQMRLDVRRDNRRRGFTGWEHASQEHWQEKLVAESTCHLDLLNGSYQIDEALLPQHIEPALHRIAKRLLHGTRIWA